MNSWSSHTSLWPVTIHESILQWNIERWESDSHLLIGFWWWGGEWTINSFEITIIGYKSIFYRIWKVNTFSPFCLFFSPVLPKAQSISCNSNHTRFFTLAVPLRILPTYPSDGFSLAIDLQLIMFWYIRQFWVARINEQHLKFKCCEWFANSIQCGNNCPQQIRFLNTPYLYMVCNCFLYLSLSRSACRRRGGTTTSTNLRSSRK